jgi:hypothetical protein
MVDHRLKDLRGTSRRDFLRWSATVAACLGVERARLLNVLNDTAGTAAADNAACATINRVVSIVDGIGGLANWTQVFPVPAVVTSTNANFAHYSLGTSMPAAGYDNLNAQNAYRYVAESPWQNAGRWKMSAFLAGRDETHTANATSVNNVGGGNSMLASIAAIQQANPTLLPVLQIGGIQFGAAPGAPAVASVGAPGQLIDLFNSAASRSLLSSPEHGALAEAYYKAFLGLNASAGRGTVAKQHGIGKVSAGLLSRNLSTQLTPTQADEQLFGISGNTPSAIQNMSRALITTGKAFALGLTSMLIMRGWNDDPHGLFSGGNNAARARADAMGKMLNGFYELTKSSQDPACSSKTLADSIVMTWSGDTAKQPFRRAGWPDGSPQGSNVVYVMGNGYLKTGWFGRWANDAAEAWNPGSGQTGGAYTGQGNRLGAAAGAAALFAVAKGDMRRVRDFYTGEPIDGVVNLNVTG